MIDSQQFDTFPHLVKALNMILFPYLKNQYIFKAISRKRLDIYLEIVIIMYFAEMISY